MLCCCRCFRRRKVYDGPFPDDAEKGPIVVEQVIDDDPTPTPTSTILGRQITHMESIPEASPRPSDDLRDRAAAMSTKPAPMPTAEEETSTAPVQRSLSPSQDASLSPRVPTTTPTGSSLLPPNTSIVARPQLSSSVSVPPTNPPPLQSSTPTPPISPPTPPPPHATPPVPEPTPPPALTPGSTAIPSSRSPLHTPLSNGPAPHDLSPKIEGGHGPESPQPSLFSRIKTILLPSSSSVDMEGGAMTDGTIDRRVLNPRVAVRPVQKRVTKAAVPSWSTEVWF